MRLLAFLLLAFLAVARAGEPLLKPGDVIALVGGEDMVVANELGYLEAGLQRAYPSMHLKVRGFAWEGDSVFEQRRDLNYPSLEAQLDSVGATVVIVQFGQMESLAGVQRLPEFINAYKKLIERLRRPVANPALLRRVILLTPFAFAASLPYTPNDAEILERHRKLVESRSESLMAYQTEIGKMATSQELEIIQSSGAIPTDALIQRDGVHLNEGGHFDLARWIVVCLSNYTEPTPSLFTIPQERREALRSKIVEKNRLWFNYTRPQNWAFLAGDRTNQPSSRDYRDPNKRWFPEEMEKFLPLIEAKEQEIWNLAAKPN